MDNIFQYAFMQRAFVVAAIIAVIAPCIGVSIVLKRLSAIGDATSHSALAGIAFGLLLGINPILGAVMFSIFAVIGIEVFRKSFGKYSEIATVVVMSAGIGLTAVLSGFITNGSTNINSFLFGSIVAITDFELYLTIGLGIAVIITSILLYKDAKDVSDLFRVWDETYDKRLCGDVIFRNDSTAYQIGVKPLRKVDLRDFSENDRIVNKFEEILRLSLIHI